MVGPYLGTAPAKRAGGPGNRAVRRGGVTAGAGPPRRIPGRG